jgi:2-polyprenyl-3-methyl-5-hydroxy-6-metoxy-1,4-benzoquinol methylase
MRADARDYWRCSQCQARFLDPDQLPDLQIEKEQYDRHENHPDDPGYRRFLTQIAEPLLERLSPGSHGLDFGCGPGPALARMLEEAGHQVSLYDPIYFPDQQSLERQYDFITATEVFEHLHDPAAEFVRLNRLLVPGGWIGIMTRLQTDDSRFARWHYRRDPTHVVFYRAETFQWLGHHLNWSVEVTPPGVVLARKKGRGPDQSVAPELRS